MILLGFHKETGNVVAIKAVAYTDKSAHHKKALKREVQMMKYMSHPNIVSIAIYGKRYTRCLFNLRL
jgi:serine/threonine protein kinase